MSTELGRLIDWIYHKIPDSGKRKNIGVNKTYLVEMNQIQTRKRKTTITYNSFFNLLLNKLVYMKINRSKVSDNDIKGFMNIISKSPDFQKMQNSQRGKNSRKKKK